MHDENSTTITVSQVFAGDTFIKLTRHFPFLIATYTIIMIWSFAESPSGSAPSENSLPLTLETQEDPNLNNLTRTDVNCDKTGTCYDGESFFMNGLSDESLKWLGVLWK